MHKISIFSIGLSVIKLKERFWLFLKQWSISIGNHAMLLVQLGINSTRDVWKFAKLDSPHLFIIGI
jgi:hypothetical protein